MLKKTISKLVIAGAMLVAGSAYAQVGRSDLLALDDEALVSAYLAAVFRDAGDDEALARKMAFKDHDLLEPGSQAEFAEKVRAAIRGGQLDGDDFVLRKVERQRKG